MFADVLQRLNAGVMAALAAFVDVVLGRKRDSSSTSDSAIEPPPSDQNASRSFFPFIFMEDLKADWFMLTPGLEPKLRARIKKAIKDFTPVDNPAGHRNAEFLKEEAEDNHPTTVTHVLLKGRRIEGFFALSSGTAELVQEEKVVSPTDRELLIPAYQPVAHIAWIARHRDATISGWDLLAWAASLALAVVQSGQGQIALTLHAYDEPTAKMWSDEFEFKMNEEDSGRISLWKGLEDWPSMPAPDAT